MADSIDGMDKFIEQHADRVVGTLCCFDRVLFRGYLPIMSGAAMARFLKSQDIRRESVKPFLLEQAARLKAHALDLCTRTGRPFWQSRVLRCRYGDRTTRVTRSDPETVRSEGASGSEAVPNSSAGDEPAALRSDLDASSLDQPTDSQGLLWILARRGRPGRASFRRFLDPRAGGISACLLERAGNRVRGQGQT